MEIFFFFSSRRRHTRLTCDWSSDVCSSDLLEVVEALTKPVALRRAVVLAVLLAPHRLVAGGAGQPSPQATEHGPILRATCRACGSASRAARACEGAPRTPRTRRRTSRRTAPSRRGSGEASGLRRGTGPAPRPRNP